jgi:hypothetical protein
MADLFREQPKLRLLIGGVIVAIVWLLYAVRVTLGIGPMRDTAGQQAPAIHYLLGALVTTAMVAIWIVVRAIMARRQ